MSNQFTPNNPLPQEAKVPEEVAVFSAEVEAEIDRHLAKYPVRRSAILPLMFIVQRECGGQWAWPPLQMRLLCRWRPLPDVPIRYRVAADASANNCEMLTNEPTIGKFVPGPPRTFRDAVLTR